MITAVYAHPLYVNPCTGCVTMTTEVGTNSATTYNIIVIIMVAAKTERNKLR